MQLDPLECLWMYGLPDAIPEPEPEPVDPDPCETCDGVHVDPAPSTRRFLCDVCNDCHDEQTVIEGCDDYGASVEVCETCALSLETCERCAIPATYLGSVIRYGGHRAWCQSCLNDGATTCDSCGDWVSHDSVRSVDWGSGEWCEPCFDDRFHYCGDCEEYFDAGESCDCETRAIREYGSTPDDGWRPYGMVDVVRVGTRLVRAPHFGVEIEVETNGAIDREDGAQRTLDALSEWCCGRGVWITHDGSLNDGFEITTHPLTLDAWRNEIRPLSDALSTLSRLGCRAWDANRAHHSVGIHVHVSLSGFTSDSHVGRFAWLFRTLRASFERAAGRTSDYASFAGLVNIAGKVKGTRSSNHSDAVNIGRRTVEVRIFRSSLIGDRVLGDVELVAAAVEYTRSRMTVADIADPAALAQSFGAYLADGYPLASRVWSGERFRVEPSRDATGA